MAGKKAKGKGGKKGGKKKLTKLEKEIAKLHKEASKLRENADLFDDFSRRMDVWLQAKGGQIAEICSFYDETKSGLVTYSQIKACLTQLEIPCSFVEQHLLIDLFAVNPDTHDVPYKKMVVGLGFLRFIKSENEDEERANDKLIVKTECPPPNCEKCGLINWDGENYKDVNPRWILILFRFTTFEKSLQSYSGHFECVVPKHSTVQTLMNIIKQHTCLSTNTLAIYTDKTGDESSRLPHEQSLDECGFSGGPVTAPEELLLYYDFSPEFVECPVLLSDYYFMGKRAYTGDKKVKQQATLYESNVLQRRAAHGVETKGSTRNVKSAKSRQDPTISSKTTGKLTVA